MTAVMRSILEQFPFWAAARWPDPLEASGPLTVVTGCGTSYNLALSIAAAMNGRGIAALAVPAGELVLRPGAYVSGPMRVVALSRSGTTTETVEAARISRARGHQVIGISCAPDTPLQAHSDVAHVFDTHPEEGIVMIASASLMLLAGYALAGLEVAPLAGQAEALLKAMAAVPVADYAGRAPFVFLGGGAQYGVALEGALKLTEMAISQTQAFHPGEYRHGPISMIDAQAAVALLYHDDTRAEEAALCAELQAKGAWVLGFGGPGDVSLPVAAKGDLAGGEILPALQLLGENFASAKGVDTSAPRHLTKVVLLEEKS